MKFRKTPVNARETYSYTEGRWTFSNTYLMRMGELEEDVSYYSGSRNAVVRDGYLYVLSYDRSGVYKINLADSSDVSLIGLGFRASADGIGDTGNVEVRLSLLGDLIVGYGFAIDGADRVVRTYEGIRCGSVATPFFQYKEFLFAWGGEFSRHYRYTFLLTPFLATICNLAEPVVKRADQSLRITYTLRETAV